MKAQKVGERSREQNYQHQLGRNAPLEGRSLSVVPALMRPSAIQ